MASLATLHPAFQPYAKAIVEVAQREGLRPVVTSTYRSIAKQRRLYREWQAGKRTYPVAYPGRSLHNYGLALDMVADDLAWLGKVWESWGGTWGGPKDPVHFQPFPYIA